MNLIDLLALTPVYALDIYWYFNQRTEREATSRATRASASFEVLFHYNI
jgi:hypothetical protein